MEFIVKGQSTNRYHKTNPVAGTWTGWVMTPEEAARMKCTRNTLKAYATVELFSASRKHIGQTIPYICAGTTLIPFDMDKNEHPELFI